MVSTKGNHRKPHILTPTKSSYIGRVIFFDTESNVIDAGDKVLLPLRLIYAIYIRREPNRVIEEKHYSTQSAEDFARWIDHIAQPKTTLRIISHNLHHDLAVTNLLNLLATLGWEVTSMYIQGTTVIIRCSKGNSRIIFEDGANRLRGSIKEWGELVGLPKMEIDTYNTEDESTLLEYCKRDVEILKLAHLHFWQFVKDNNLGGETETLASQALSAYRHRFMTHKIHIHDNVEALELERFAYGGGRVSCFRVGLHNSKTYYYVDINSMYPYLMLTYPVPTQLLGVIHNPPVEKLETLTKQYLVIADVVVSPTLPVFRRRVGVYTLYPCYTARFALSTPEVIFALQQGWIEKVNRVAVYQGDVIFKDYVEYLYNIRIQAKTQGNLVYSQIAKIMLNSLYGKFGAYAKSIKPIEGVEIPEDGIDEILVGNDTQTRGIYKIGNTYYVETITGEGYNSFPGIACHITAYGRMYLWSLIELAGLENVYYCDTDSLIVNEIGFDRIAHLVDSTGLGKLKLEGTADEIEIVARKFYRFGEIRKHKGIPKDAEQVDTLTFIRTVWPKLRTTLKPNCQGYYLVRQRIRITPQTPDGMPDKTGVVHPFTQPPEQYEKDRFELYRS